MSLYIDLTSLIYYYNESIFSKPNSRFGGNVKVEADLFKLDMGKLKTVLTHFNNLKPENDELDVNRQRTVYVGLKKLSDAVENDVVKNHCLIP